ncbi:MAG: sensor histidine kinase [Phycisphaerales bacterium]
MNPADGPHHGNSANGSPAPVHRPVTPEATYVQVDRVANLVTRLCDLLDGSMRCVSAAKTNIQATIAVTGHAAADEACRQLVVAADQLDKMSELVHAAMQSPSHPIGSPNLSRCRPVLLGEAITHAIEVVRPLAARHSVDLTCELSEAASACPAGGLYTVVLNGLQNAVEAVGRTGGGGSVSVKLAEIPAPASLSYGKDSRPWYDLTLTDDGIGPPSISDLSRIFDMGFTTKPGAPGIGLAVARSVVQSMGGSIDLAAGDTGRRAGRQGAVLRVRFPSPLRP